MPLIDETHDLARVSWVTGAAEHPDFPIQNLPLGVFDTADAGSRAGTAIGDMVLDLRGLSQAGLLDASLREALGAPTLNPLFAKGREALRRLRRQLSALLSDPSHRTAVAPYLHDVDACTMRLPDDLSTSEI